MKDDTELALKLAQANLDQLCRAKDKGFEIVCSCLTWGFMFRNLLKRGAYYATEYQEAVEAPPDMILKPDTRKKRDGTRGFLHIDETLRDCRSYCS